MEKFKKLNREEMKKISGGGPPTCAFSKPCDVTIVDLETGNPYDVVGECTTLAIACGCWEYGGGKYAYTDDCFE